ncbi:MAG: hypothetical protein ABSH39_05925 [Candidatus Acidiferrum sp.]|jgi:hypothetical protein
MNNGAYMGQDGQTIAPKVQELLTKDLGAAASVSFTIENVGVEGITAKSILKDMSTTFFGGKSQLLFTIHFDVNQSRPMQLDAHMIRQGAGCGLGSLAYATTVAKRVAGPVSLGDDGKFTGDAEAAGTLNARRDLLKKCDAFAVKEGGLAGLAFKIDRILKITPREDGAQVVAVTMPVSKSMGFSASLRAKEFLEMVALLESTL